METKDLTKVELMVDMLVAEMVEMKGKKKVDKMAV